VQGFKVEINRCQKVSTKIITCHFTVTNQQSDRLLQLFVNGLNGSPPSYFVDSGGMEIIADRGQLGSKSGAEWPRTDAVTDVPIKVSLEFAVGDPRATSIAKLSISLKAEERHFRVDLRKIPLEGN